MTTQEYCETNKYYIIEQYQSGKSTTQISKEMNINNSYISRILHDNDIEIRKKQAKPQELDKFIPQIVELFKLGGSIYQISKELKLNKSSVARRLKKLGYNTSLKSTTRKDKIKEHTNKIVELYKSGKSTYQIATIFKCGNSSIYNLLIKNNIKLRDTNKYTADYEFFSVIDSHEKAYLLGLLYADGHVKTNTQVWGISLIDKELVEDIKTLVNYTGPIYYKDYRDNFPGYVCKPMFELLISSPQMKADLIRLGCVPKKTLVLKYPTIEQVPLDFRNSFLLGFLDGDGSIGYTFGRKSIKFKIQFTSTKEMCEGIRDEIISRDLCKSTAKIYKASKKNDKNTYYCVIDGFHCVPFLQWLYKDSKIRLHRKWMKFKQLEEYYQYRHLLITPSGNKKGWKLKRLENLV